MICSCEPSQEQCIRPEYCGRRMYWHSVSPWPCTLVAQEILTCQACKHPKVSHAFAGYTLSVLSILVYRPGNPYTDPTSVDCAINGGPRGLGTQVTPWKGPAHGGPLFVPWPTSGLFSSKNCETKARVACGELAPGRYHKITSNACGVSARDGGAEL